MTANQQDGQTRLAGSQAQHDQPEKWMGKAMKKTALAALMLLAFSPATSPAWAAISSVAWGGVDNKGVDLFTLTNKSGMEVKITNYGGVITYTSIGYGGRYGALIGRFANRIKNNIFTLNGKAYKISREAYIYSESPSKPYDEQVWTARPVDGDEPQLELTLLDRNGTMGFPGTMHVTVTYTLTANNILRIAYRAATDKDTVVSMTNHAYFNLAGDTSGSVLDHLLTVNADAITAGDETNTPTGEMRPVAGTAFDFRKPTPIGAHINDPDPALVRAKGYDQNYAINGARGTMRLAARLEDPGSGRVLEEWTTQPGLQVYTANYAPPTVGLIKGYKQHGAVALEAQGFPNAPNLPSFPSTVLKRDQRYDQVTEYRFSVAR
jgi:aldose 1-epimerase